MSTIDESRIRRLLDVGRSLVAELDPQAMLARVLEAATDITGARYAALWILNQDRTELDRFLTAGNGFPPGHPEMRTMLGVPVLIRGEAWGNLYLAEKEHGEFTEADEETAVILAEWAGTAIVNAMARSVEADRLRTFVAVADAERRRFARELHDETLQGLGGLRMLLASAMDRDDPARTEAALRRVMDETDREIESLRAIITELRPAALDELGLRPALETLLARHHSEALRIVSELDLPDPEADDRIDPELETAAYRIVQEALTNVAEHAGASSVRVTVVSSHDGVRIELADDGVGFDPDTPTPGLGLTGMRERTSLLGGSLEIESGGRGTIVKAQLPAQRA